MPKTSNAGFRESPDIQCIPLTNTNTHTLQQREVTSCGYKLCTGSREHWLHTAGKLGAEDRKGSGMPSAEAPSVKSSLAGAVDSPVTKAKEQSSGKAGCQRSHSAGKSAQLNPLTIQTRAIPA